MCNRYGLHSSCGSCVSIQGAEKVSRKVFLAIFLAISRNFEVKFYTFSTCL